MTICEAINKLDSLMQNTYTQKEKVEWLSRLDAIVKRLIIGQNECENEVLFHGYNQETPFETELLVPSPFDEIYLRYMEAQIHYNNGEYDKYNNAIMMYNTAYEAYASDYIRHHKPLRKGNRFRF